MAAKKEDEIVLSFHNSLLRQSDLALLDDGRWLNDNLIGFMFEYFEYEVFKSISPEVLFVSPDVTQFIKLGQDSEVSIFLEPLNLPSRQLIFFAVNDNEQKMATGGSHWSLLVYNRQSNTFSHYDSFSDSNSRAAVAMAASVQLSLKASHDEIAIEEIECPQQSNSSYCGVYVISITDHLCRQYAGEKLACITSTITPPSIAQKRKQIRDLILQLQ